MGREPFESLLLASVALRIGKPPALSGSYARFDQVNLGKALYGRDLRLFLPVKSVVTNKFRYISLLCCN
jgi:hypothetical protein